MGCGGLLIIFRVSYRIESGLSIGERNAVIQAFATEAIEGNDLQFGGGGRGDWQSGIAEPHSTNTATEGQRRAVEGWLRSQPRVVEFVVGPLAVDEEGAGSAGGR
jgi:uncharacterized protein YggL (DUF469 family)